MSDDLIDRLRECAECKSSEAWGRIDGGQDLCIGASLATEAADELSRLRAEVERLTGALGGALADSARLTLALADERRHSDAMEDALGRATLYVEGPMADRIGPMVRQCRDALTKHRARRQG